MFLFILESIGMPELLLVGIVALIIFGPRKLPEMAKMIGKTMAEFRKVTGEFKETWEKEAKFDLDEDFIENSSIKSIENGSHREVIENEKETDKLLPEIREINAADFDKNLIDTKIPVIQTKIQSEKKNWL